jgi:STE24 endopeptidase
MNARKFLLGSIAGASLGYATVRMVQAIAALRRGIPAFSNDPAAYGRARRALAVAGTLRTTLTTLGFAYGPIPKVIERALQPLPRWLRPGIFFGGVMVASCAFELPISFIEEYAVERRYGLTEQNPGGYLADYCKSAAISTAIVAGLGLLGGAIVRYLRSVWPIVAAAAMLPLFILGNFIVPLYILPLFNRFEPLHGPLEERLRRLAGRFGVGDAEILRMDMSKQTKKANAFVAGLGSTHRIVLGDTLIDTFTPDEIEFVVAHELGHYVTRDTWRMIGVAEWLTANVLGIVAFGLRDDSSEDSLFLLHVAAWLGVGMLAARPAVNVFSRSREWAADVFALRETCNPRGGIAAFQRLRDQNLAEEDPPMWYECFFASHPSLGKRIEALELATEPAP